MRRPLVWLGSSLLFAAASWSGCHASPGPSGTTGCNCVDLLRDFPLPRPSIWVEIWFAP
jgi:hypothetical protein